MNSLHTRLSLAFLLIIGAIGAGFYLVDRWSTQQYYQELTQRLNASIAMYVTGQTTLIENGVVNRTELERLAERAMVINPSVEVYLLDETGRILDHALPPESVRLDRVDLDAVRTFISGEAKMPIRGTDPRSPDKDKVFSAAEVVDEGTVQGYLYVVLGGKQYDQLADTIRGTYVQVVSIGAISALVVGGFLVGLLVFGLLTSRLRHLTNAVQEFANFDFDPASVSALLRRDAPEATKILQEDEIHRLDTAFVAMARKISEQFASLQETDRLRRELISNVSHDLRTPLATMHGYIDTLLLKNDELTVEERAHYLTIALKHTQRLGSLIDNLFELSKLDSGSMTLAIEPFSLAELVHDVAQDFELDARRLGITIAMKETHDAATVRADIALIQRVLENLIRNAIENTPQGGQITLSIARLKDTVSVAVADTGRGIPEDALGSIFERFYRAHEGHVNDSNSTGLGLAIVKRILDLHGSRITVESHIDKGTRFEFNLPTHRAA
jgi:signal transduction histidine kinase